MSRWIVMVALVACATDAPVDNNDNFDFQVDSNDGKADGVAAVFDANNVLSDDLFGASGAMTVDDVQGFLEHTPYGNRSWLASYQLGGVSAAQLIVDAAQAEQIHPLVLVARMQVETTLVNKTIMPSQRTLDRALGCDCPDGSACSSQAKGLANQLQCGSSTMRRWFDASVDGTGQWRKGTTGRTLDPRSVTPANHATAALYAYTPWVLVGTGGNWLTWNVTRKYVRFAEQSGLVHP